MHLRKTLIQPSQSLFPKQKGNCNCIEIDNYYHSVNWLLTCSSNYCFAWQTFNEIQKLLSKTNGKVVGDLMTPSPLVVHESTSLEDAARYCFYTLIRTTISFLRVIREESPWLTNISEKLQMCVISQFPKGFSDDKISSSY